MSESPMSPLVPRARFSEIDQARSLCRTLPEPDRLLLRAERPLYYTSVGCPFPPLKYVRPL